MAIYPSDLQYTTPDADGILRLNRGTVPQTKVPFPSFVGDVRFYRGLAADVGQGQLLGWQLVGEISEGTLIRVATSDADVGVISGSNDLSLQIPDKTPTGTVDAAHDHGGDTGTTSLIKTVTDNALNQTDVPDNNATFPIDEDLSSPKTLDLDPITFDPLTATLAPVSIGFFLIEFIGITV